MTVACRMYLDTEIEGEIIGYDINTKMIIIKPTLAFNRQMRKDTHLVNIDYFKDISIVKEIGTREEENDHFTKEELPDEDKVLAKRIRVQSLPRHERDDKPEEDPGHCQDAHRHRRAHQEEDFANA
jgi:hypothetical protein